jgi:hypothetical protein
LEQGIRITQDSNSPALVVQGVKVTLNMEKPI